MDVTDLRFSRFVSFIHIKKTCFTQKVHFICCYKIAANVLLPTSHSISANRDVSTERKPYLLYLGEDLPVYGRTGRNLFRRKKNQGLTPMQKYYLSDHLSSKKNQEEFGIARRSESNEDYSVGTDRSYFISNGPTPTQRNKMRNHLSSFVGSIQHIL